jgi:hypothetical protein
MCRKCQSQDTERDFCNSVVQNLWKT